MADGWIKVWRKIADSQMWLEKPFSKGQAWIDLLLLATASDHVSKYKGRDKAYKAGTVHFSLLFLTDRWGWSRNKVYRFLEKLQKDEMIVYQGRTSNGTINRTQNGTVNGTIDDTINDTFITIVNWALYQSKQTRNGTINDTINDTTDGTTKRTSNGTHPKKDIHKNDISKEKKSRSAPDSPSGIPKRGTKAFKAKSHLLLKREEGTVDDIPDMYRDMFDDFARYYDWRNQ